MTSSGWERIQPCQDWQARDRELRIYLTDGNRIGLHTPPGDVATINLTGARQLRERVTAATLEALNRGAGANLIIARTYHETHDLTDHRGDPHRVGVQAKDGVVAVSVFGWFKGTPAQIRKLADSLHVAADVAEQQQLRRS